MEVYILRRLRHMHKQEHNWTVVFNFCLHSFVYTANSHCASVCYVKRRSINLLCNWHHTFHRVLIPTTNAMWLINKAFQF